MNLTWNISDAMNIITPIIMSQLDHDPDSDLTSAKIIHLTGSPGIGKTTIIKNMCKHTWNAKAMVIKFPSLSMEELSGLPNPEITVSFDGKEVEAVKWTLSDILRQLFTIYAKQSDGRVVLVLDDCHFCPEELHAYMMSILDYELKGYKIPTNVAMVVITNDSSIAGAIPFPSPLMSRMIHFKLTTTANDWLEVMTGKLNHSVAAFLSMDQHSGFIITSETRSDAYCCPRSWYNLSTTLDIFEKDNVNLSMTNHIKLSSGHIGPEACIKFSEFAMLFNKHDMKTIFGVGKYTLPDDELEKYTFVLAAMSYFLKDANMVKHRAKLMGVILTELAKVNKIYVTVSFSFMNNTDKKIRKSATLTLINQLSDELATELRELFTG